MVTAGLFYLAFKGGIVQMLGADYATEKMAAIVFLSGIAAKPITTSIVMPLYAQATGN
jgi:hypothetical protein